MPISILRLMFCWTSAEVAFDLVVLIDEAADTSHLVVGQLPDLGARVDPGGFADLLQRLRPTP